MLHRAMHGVITASVSTQNSQSSNGELMKRIFTTTVLALATLANQALAHEPPKANALLTLLNNTTPLVLSVVSLNGPQAAGIASASGLLWFSANEYAAEEGNPNISSYAELSVKYTTDKYRGVAVPVAAAEDMAAFLGGAEKSTLCENAINNLREHLRLNGLNDSQVEDEALAKMVLDGYRKASNI